MTAVSIPPTDTKFCHCMFSISFLDATNPINAPQISVKLKAILTKAFAELSPEDETLDICFIRTDKESMIAEITPVPSNADLKSMSCMIAIHPTSSSNEADIDAKNIAAPLRFPLALFFAI